VQQST